MRYATKREYKNAYNNWECKSCGEIFRTRRLLGQHRKDSHSIYGQSDGQLNTKGIYCCRFCEKEWTTTKSGFRFHENHCSENPNRKIIKGHPHTEETRKRLSECAKKNHLGGWYTSKSFNYNGIKLDSSYEVTLAQDLDKNNIKWERPKPLYWKLNGSEHRYYPDFYLPEFNIYVDTKNDFLINNVNPRFGITDVEKIRLVEAQNNVRVLILDKNNLSWRCLLGSLSGR